MQEQLWLWCILAAGGGILAGKFCHNLAARWIARELITPMPLLSCQWVQLCSAGLLFSLLLRFGWSWQLGKWAVLGHLLLTVSLIDACSFIIPDTLLLGGFCWYGLSSQLLGETATVWFWQGLWGGLATLPLLFFVLLADSLLQRETIGGGDLKLFFLLGVYLGPQQAWLTLFFSCLIGLIGLLLCRALRQGQPFPFGPSLALAAWIVVLWGEELLAWYWQWAL